MDTSKTTNANKDLYIDEIVEQEAIGAKKSRYAKAIEDSDDDADLDESFSDFAFSDSDFNSIYDDTH